MYEVSVLEVIRHFGLSASGNSYQRVAKALKTLNENTALYLPKTLPSGERGILMTQLFDTLFFGEAGTVQFRFSPNAAPLVFDLKKNFYSFHLQELARIHGKYGLILLKLWESYRHGHEYTTTITGSTEDWQGWFLGKEKHVTAGRFYTNVLKRATEELEEKLDAECTLMSYKKGRKIVSYELTIIDKSKLVKSLGYFSRNIFNKKSTRYRGAFFVKSTVCTVTCEKSPSSAVSICLILCASLSSSRFRALF